MFFQLVPLKKILSTEVARWNWWLSWICPEWRLFPSWGSCPSSLQSLTKQLGLASVWKSPLSPYRALASKLWSWLSILKPSSLNSHSQGTQGWPRIWYLETTADRAIANLGMVSRCFQQKSLNDDGLWGCGAQDGPSAEPGQRCWASFCVLRHCFAMFAHDQAAMRCL